MIIQKTRPAVAGRITLRNALGALFFAGGLVLSMALPATELLVETEINALLEVVAKSGCDFKRNGTLHSSPDAAEHLALKYSRGQRYVETTENFIDRRPLLNHINHSPTNVILPASAREFITQLMCIGINWVNTSLLRTSTGSPAQRP